MKYPPKPAENRVKTTAKTMKLKKLSGLLSILVFMVMAQVAIASPRPNVVIFYVDDLGWQDVQLNDLDAPCVYETPNVAKLAEQGMNFTQGYSPAPTCAPSRAGIMTGQHPAKLRFTHVTGSNIPEGKATDELVEPYLGAHMPLDALTLATALRDNGYKTGHAGKWHTGLTSAEFGFEFTDQDRGIHRGMEDRTKDFATADDARWPLSKKKYPPFSEKKPEGISYPYDQVTESALTFMEQSKHEPFFLNLCHWMVHWPVLTRNGELLEYYCDKMGQQFPPKPGDMRLEGQQNPYFAAMVTSVDWSLGRIIDYLEQTEDPRNPGKKLIETTYVFFTSDNGGAEVRGREIISDNAPLKYGKKYTEEGGVRVPMIIAGPGISRGSQFDGLVNQLDYFPTLLKLTGSEIGAKAKQALSGVDISPVLWGDSRQVRDENGVERENLFWHFPHNGPNMKAAIREGDFKLYKNYQTRNYSLHRLYRNGERDDLEEMNNIVAEPAYAAVVRKLSANLERHLVENDVEGPYLNPNYKNKTKPAAQIEALDFQSSSRQATVRLNALGPMIKTAYVIYRDKPGAAKKAAENKRSDGAFWRAQTGIKIPAEIESNGNAVKATIPDQVEAYCFLIIDENNYQIFSDVQLLQ